MGVILPSVPPDDVLAKYIEAALRDFVYEILEDDGSYFGTVPGFQGAWANADTVEECRRELAEVLEGWIILGIERGHPIPDIPSVSLMPKEKPHDASLWFIAISPRREKWTRSCCLTNC